MDKAFRIVIPNPSLTVILSKAKNLFISLRTGSVRNLVFSERDCHVAPLHAPLIIIPTGQAMTVLKESLNLG
jgi:hypothetical protein